MAIVFEPIVEKAAVPISQGVAQPRLCRVVGYCAVPGQHEAPICVITPVSPREPAAHRTPPPVPICVTLPDGVPEQTRADMEHGGSFLGCARATGVTAVWL